MKIAKLLLITLLIAFSSKSFSAKKYETLSDTTKLTNSVLLAKSLAIESVKFRKNKKKGEILYIRVGKKGYITSNSNSTAYGIAGKSETQEARNATGPIFDSIEVLNGGYDEINVDKLSVSQNLYTIKKINFPLRLKLHSGKEFVEFELKEAGVWDIDINYKNN